MFFRVILFIWDFMLNLAAISRITDDEKDLETLLLRVFDTITLVHNWRFEKSLL
jgi:hypothetical protein